MATNIETIMAFVETTLGNLAGVDKVFRMDKTIRSRKDIVEHFVTNAKESWWMIFREANDVEPLDINGTVLYIHNVTIQGLHRYHDDPAFANSSEKEFQDLVDLVQFAFADPQVFANVANAGHQDPPQLVVSEKRKLTAPDTRFLHYCEILLRPQECVETS